MIHRSETHAALRFEDQEECRLAGMEPGAMLDLSINRSTRSFRIDFEDEGVAETLAYWGWRDDGLAASSCQAWMLSCPGIEHHRTFAARRSREFLVKLLESHYLIWVLVDPSYLTAVRWLEWLGFRSSGPRGPFVQYEITRGGRA